MALVAPEPIGPQHVVTAFQSGSKSLDDWLQKRALANQKTGASRTFVACDGANVVGYYALASGAVALNDATGKLRRNMPDPIPVVLLARLAVDQTWQKRGLGRALVQDASRRVLEAAALIGVRGLLVQSLSPDAKAFYERLGFSASPMDPMLLMVAVTELQAAVSASRN